MAMAVLSFCSWLSRALRMRSFIISMGVSCATKTPTRSRADRHSFVRVHSVIFWRQSTRLSVYVLGESSPGHSRAPYTEVVKDTAKIARALFWTLDALKNSLARWRTAVHNGRVPEGGGGRRRHLAQPLRKKVHQPNSRNRRSVIIVSSGLSHKNARRCGTASLLSSPEIQLIYPHNDPQPRLPQPREPPPPPALSRGLPKRPRLYQNTYGESVPSYRNPPSFPP